MSEHPDRTLDVVVVGAGIGGLVVGRELAAAGRSVLVLDGRDAPGGAVRAHTVAGLRLDAGAESFGTRGAIVADLIGDLGLADDVCLPSRAGAWVELPGGPRPMPTGGVLGLPAHPFASQVRRTLGPLGTARAALDLVAPARIGADRGSLGALVRTRMGARVVDRMVRPMVGGIYGADPDQVALAALGARLVRDAKAGGYVVEHIYQSDPDRPDRKSPLAQPGVDIAEGDVLLAANGRDLLSAADPAELLRNQAGKQVLMRVRPKDKTEPRDVIVKPVTMQQEADLRYAEWEYTRRLAVDQASAGKIGYVHLPSMGASDISQWAEQYTPVFTREGLIIDVRHNRGGNIDSWILEKLMRKAWMYWQTHRDFKIWNMQQAFRGHMVVLCDEFTGSDGEAFTEGFRRLGLGKVIGTRTWGGEIWLTSSNQLVDRGIATAAEWGVFGADRQWLIEGHGVDPDMVVDNLPHATFQGRDAQLDAAIEYLKTEIRNKPIEQPAPPKYPDKSFKYPAEVVR